MRFPRLFVALAALALPTAALPVPMDTANSTDHCATAVAEPADFSSHQQAAAIFLASVGQRPQSQVLRVTTNPAAEIAQVRGYAQRVAMSQSSRARDEAIRAVTAVANYRGSDPSVMNRLLARVDSAADSLHASLTRGGAGDMQTGAFKCNADRLECKQACQEAKGKACCCGCGVSYVACLFLG